MAESKQFDAEKFVEERDVYRINGGSKVVSWVREAHAAGRDAERGKWLDYIALIQDEAQSAYMIAWVHGWKPRDDLEEGAAARDALDFTAKDIEQRIARLRKSREDA